jgi:hypothetical protein
VGTHAASRCLSFCSVVTRRANSVHTAYVDQRDQIPVSIKVLYDKLSHVEGNTLRELVRYVAIEVSELVDLANGHLQPLMKGYRVRILDGNRLCKTDHRLDVLRGTAAAMPGQSLMLLDPGRIVIDDIVCCEDGHREAFCQGLQQESGRGHSPAGRGDERKSGVEEPK